MFCLPSFLFHLIYETTEMTIYKFSLGSKYKKISIIFHESMIPLITKGTIILCATKKEKKCYSLNYEMQNINKLKNIKMSKKLLWVIELYEHYRIFKKQTRFINTAFSYFMTHIFSLSTNFNIRGIL